MAIWLHGAQKKPSDFSWLRFGKGTLTDRVIWVLWTLFRRKSGSVPFKNSLTVKGGEERRWIDVSLESDAEINMYG